MDRTGCYASCWLLALCYVMFVMNHLVNPALDWDIPLQRLTGNTVDISILLRYPFWHKVYAIAQEVSYPSDTKEQLCYMVGFSENVGNALTYKLLMCDTHKIIHRSSIRSAEEPSTTNVRAAPIDGENIKQYIKSKHDTLQKISTIADELPLDVTGRSIVIPQENGERVRARVVEIIDEGLIDPTRDKAYLDSLSTQEREDFIARHTKFRLQYEKSAIEEIMSYQQIMDHLDEDQKSERVWKFRRISGHEGPLTKKKDKNYDGSSYNVMIEWENGEVTTEPLNTLLHVQYMQEKMICLISLDGTVSENWRSVKRNYFVWLTKPNFGPSEQLPNICTVLRFLATTSMHLNLINETVTLCGKTVLRSN
jgi:hypothetical protein